MARFVRKLPNDRSLPNEKIHKNQQEAFSSKRRLLGVTQLAIEFVATGFAKFLVHETRRRKETIEPKKCYAYPTRTGKMDQTKGS